MKIQLTRMLAATLLFATIREVIAQGTAFTYQGQLVSSGAPASGIYNLSFTLFTVPAGGSAAAGPVITNGVIVTNGLFTVTIDFGSGVFIGQTNWLEIGVETNGVNTFTTLAPRQQLTPTPYAIFAHTASNLLGTLPAVQLSGVVSTSILPGFQYPYVTISGGGGNSAVGFATVGGGSGNTANGGGGSTVSGGGGNTASGYSATVGGGNNNTAAGNYSTVPGGNANEAAGQYSFAAGQQAQAVNQGAFVWADSQNAPFTSTANDQFLIRAQGGVGINTNNPNGAALAVNGAMTANSITAGSFSGNGGGLTNLNAAQLTGSPAGTPPANVSLVLNMVWIVPGTFVMGDTSSDPDYQSDEGPQTVVTLTNGFWMGQHPVTQGEYLAVIGSYPSYFTGDLSRPVEVVNWFDATNFCYTLTQRERSAGRLPTGWAYRLPTEAEWEYCCRALNTSRFYFGDDPGDSASLTNYAWYSVNSGGSTQPVGKLLPNAWGLVDMVGNVFEWCQDWYGAYPGGSVTNPQGAATGSNRVLRGGSWYDGAASCRSAQRYGINPSFANYGDGFRVVLAAGQ